MCPVDCFTYSGGAKKKKTHRVFRLVNPACEKNEQALVPGPPSGASLGGPTMGQIGWGGPSTGPTLFLVQQGCLRVGVSRCGPAAVVGRGC